MTDIVIKVGASSTVLHLVKVVMVIHLSLSLWIKQTDIVIIKQKIHCQPEPATR
jgi:hypothetical protein